MCSYIRVSSRIVLHLHNCFVKHYWYVWSIFQNPTSFGRTRRNFLLILQDLEMYILLLISMLLKWTSHQKINFGILVLLCGYIEASSWWDFMVGFHSSFHYVIPFRRTKVWTTSQSYNQRWIQRYSCNYLGFSKQPSLSFLRKRQILE